MDSETLSLLLRELRRDPAFYKDLTDMMDAEYIKLDAVTSELERKRKEILTRLQTHENALVLRAKTYAAANRNSF